MKSHTKSNKRKIIIIPLVLLSIILVLILINFIPAFSLKTKGMSVLEGEWVNVFYESEENAAKDVFEYADSETGKIAKKLGFSKKQNVNIFIYDKQSTMQMKKYGLMGQLLDLDWYIGDNIGTNVILTSPANPGQDHTYDSVKYAVLHEIVHAYVSVMNPKIRLWLTEGMALYLSNGDVFHRDYLDRYRIPSYKDTKTQNPITFSNCGGYTFAHTYIEYLDVTYGWDSVMELIKTEDYESVFGRSSKEIYDEWVAYLNHYPR